MITGAIYSTYAVPDACKLSQLISKGIKPFFADPNRLAGLGVVKALRSA